MTFRHTLTCIASLALTGSVLAQASTTLPSGWDTTDGYQLATANNDNENFWVGWSLDTATRLDVPSRVIHLYSPATFPWTGATKVITGLAVRRDGPFTTSATTAHTKTIRIRMSTTTQPVHAPNNGFFDANHGANVIDVFGTPNNPKTVNFPSTAAPTTGNTAPFNVQFKLDRSFIMRSRAEALAIELRTYSMSVTAGLFRVDAVRYPNTNYNGGVLSVFYSTHCLGNRTFYTGRPRYIGGSLSHVWRTRSSAGKIMVAWLGAQLPMGIPIPGTGDAANNIPACELHVSPDIVSAAVTNTGPESAVYLQWGSIPNDPNLISAKIAHQACRLDPAANAAGLGLTRAVEFQVGTGYDPTVCLASSVYSYGDINNVRIDGKPINPDTELHPRYFFRRAVIFDVQ